MCIKCGKTPRSLCLRRNNFLLNLTQNARLVSRIISRRDAKSAEN